MPQKSLNIKIFEASAIAMAAMLATTQAALSLTAEKETTLSTKIVSAIVYSDRAQVTRSGKVDLGIGSYKLVCDDLPQNFEESSLMVSSSGSAKAKILGVDVVTVRGLLADAPRYKELKEKLSKLQDRKDTLDIELAAALNSISYLDDLGKFPFEKGSSKLATEIFRVQDWKNHLEFLAAERIKLNERIRDKEKSIEKVKEEIAWIQKKLEEMKMREDSSKRIVIDVEAYSTGNLVFDIGYNIRGALWVPEYTIRYKPSESKANLSYNARIRQSTGEDWQSVATTLSTAQPSIGARAPELEPYYLSRKPPIRAKSMMIVAETKQMTEGIMPQSEISKIGEEKSKTVTARTSLEASPFAASFSIPKPVDLPTGADPRKVLILEGDLNVEASYYTVPRLSQNVFVRGKATNTLEVPLLEGNAEVYVETGAGSSKQSTFVGKALIHALVPGQDFIVPLGIDQDFKVTQKLEKKEYLTKEGAVTKKIRYHYLTTLESYKPGAVEVELRDRIPVSTLKELKVTGVDLRPRPSEELENGIIKWTVSPTPKEKLEIRISYTIEFPGDWDEFALNLE